QRCELGPRGGEGGGGGGGHGGSRVGVRVSRTHTRALRRPCQPGEGRRLRGRAGPARRPSGSARRGGMTGPDDTAAALAAAGAYRRLAEQALADRPLARDSARALLGSPDEDLPAVLWAGFAARSRHFGRRVKLCVLQNARSGLCPEDCGYCSQSAVSTADIRRYRLLPVADLVAGARRAAATGAGRYCMVTSARGPSASDIAHFARAARAIRAELPELELCVSLGIMEEAQARTLGEAGVDFVNHNLNTSRRFYPAICSTHTYDDRRATARGSPRRRRPIVCARWRSSGSPTRAPRSGPRAGASARSARRRASPSSPRTPSSWRATSPRPASATRTRSP